jgi:hypothetical protein
MQPSPQGVPSMLEFGMLPVQLTWSLVRVIANSWMEWSMLWKILQELGYEKQLRYYGTQVTYEGSEPMWHVQVYIFTPKPFRGIFEVKKIHAAIAPRRTFYAGIRDAACPAYMVTHLCHHQLLDGMEYAHFPPTS